jgi:hypothetical protein
VPDDTCDHSFPGSLGESGRFGEIMVMMPIMVAVEGR